MYTEKSRLELQKENEELKDQRDQARWNEAQMKKALDETKSKILDLIKRNGW